MTSYLSMAISALDSPKSIIPFWVKDTIDNAGRTVMAASEGGKHEAREKFIEENGTSLFWIGGIPAFRFMTNEIAKKKGFIDTTLSFKRINSNGVQNYHADQLVETVMDNKKPLLDAAGNAIKKIKYAKEDLQGIELGGDAIKAVQNELSKTGYIINGAKGKYKIYHTALTAASVLVNLFMLTVAVPKFNQFISRKIISKETKNKIPENVQGDELNLESSKKQSFGAAKNAFLESLEPLKSLFNVKSLFNFTKIAEDAQTNVVSSMLLLDYGISGSRVTFIPRDKNERIEYAVKEGGVILFFYYASDLIKKGLAKIAKACHTPISLDYKTIADKDFAQKMKNPGDTDELFHFVKVFETDKKDKVVDLEKYEKIADNLKLTDGASDDLKELKVIKFIDNELSKVTNKDIGPDNVFKNFTLQMAQKRGLISVEYDSALGKWVRDAKKYIETGKLLELNQNLEDFYKEAIRKTGSTIENTITKTKFAKGLSVFGNIAICSLSLSILLPKLQYLIREHRTKTNNAPGIKYYQELAAKNKLKV